MKRRLVIFSFLFLLSFVAAHAQQKNTLRYEVMLNGNMTDSLKRIKFINCLDISPDRYIAIASSGKMYLLGWGGMSQLGKKSELPISSYAFTSEGLLMVVRGKSLCYIGRSGTYKEIVKLPSSDMGIAGGKAVVYLFDRNKKDKRYMLYAYAKGGVYNELLVSPKPVSAVVEMSDSVYVAIGSGVYSYSPSVKNVSLVVGLQKGNEIVSMTVDPDRNILFLSTKDTIYAIKDQSFVKVTGDFGGGIIKYFNNGLIVFSPGNQSITRIVNIADSLIF